MPSPPPRPRSAIPISSLLSYSSSSESEDEDDERDFGRDSEPIAGSSTGSEVAGSISALPVSGTPKQKFVTPIDRPRYSSETAAAQEADDDIEQVLRVPEPPGLSGVEKISFNECAEILYVVSSLRPYRKPRGLKTIAWNAVLDTLHRNGYVREKKLDWLKSRVRNLIEFHENGGFAALDDWNSNVVRNEEEVNHKIKKRRRKTKKKFDLTESSISCLATVSIELGRDIRKYTQDWLSPLPIPGQVRGSVGWRKAMEAVEPDSEGQESPRTGVAYPSGPSREMAEVRPNFQPLARSITSSPSRQP